jgi:hypothetical protein
MTLFRPRWAFFSSDLVPVLALTIVGKGCRGRLLFHFSALGHLSRQPESKFRGIKTKTKPLIHHWILQRTLNVSFPVELNAEFN